MALAACAPPPPPPLNILVVTLDTTRADALSCYGFPEPTTPVVDALARRGVRFTRAYAPMSQTLPSHATLFTGKDPRVHGALENHLAIEPGVTMLAERLQERGYATSAFVAARVLDDSTGLQRGFDVFDQVEVARKDAERPADEVTDAALAWARGMADDDRPSMLWVHYFDAHGPYEPVEISVAAPPVRQWVKERDAVQDAPLSMVANLWHRYVNEIAVADRQLGRLLDGLESLGWMDETVVLVVADHGEGFYEHGDNSHGLQVTEEHVRVPLVLALPDDELAGTVVDGPVVLADLAPTLVAFARAGVVLEGAGENLVPALRSGRSAAVRPVFVERPHYEKERFEERFAGRGLVHGDLVAVIVGHDKLVRQPDGSVQLHDLQADPFERRDLSAERPELAARLTRLVEDWIAAHPIGELGAGGEASAERKEALQQLGY
jgi:arylsulfatase A-like enzyme